MSRQSVIVHGERACGKTRNAQSLKKALGLQRVQDDFQFVAGAKFSPSDTLYLTNEEVPDSYQYMAMSFDDAMRLVKGGAV